MREIDSSVIRDTVCALTIKADYILPDEVLGLIKNEADGTLPGTLCGSIAENAVISAEGKYPICQDTGMVTVYAEIGQDVHINGSFTDAVNAGVRDASEKGYLRRSVVADPFDRVNTGDNTPAVIYTDLVGGDGIHLTVLPKGFGSENKCAIRMLNPSDGVDGAVEFAVSAAVSAGASACPPMFIGVAVGGTFDGCAVLSKKALLMPEHEPTELEKRILDGINARGSGVQGMGGKTALRVNAIRYPTHIAGLPVAVCICCHACRHAEATI